MEFWDSLGDLLGVMVMLGAIFAVLVLLWLPFAFVGEKVKEWRFNRQWRKMYGKTQRPS